MCVVCMHRQIGAQHQCVRQMCHKTWVISSLSWCHKRYGDASHFFLVFVFCFKSIIFALLGYSFTSFPLLLLVFVIFGTHMCDNKFQMISVFLHKQFLDIWAWTLSFMGRKNVIYSFNIINNNNKCGHLCQILAFFSSVFVWSHSFSLPLKFEFRLTFVIIIIFYFHRFFKYIFCFNKH